MITAILKINVSVEKQVSAVQTVRSILGWTSAQPGCISMAFYQDTNNPGTMMLFEEWEDWDSLENHIRSDSFRNILELMELSIERPEITFHSVSESKGLEFIERLRG